MLWEQSTHQQRTYGLLLLAIVGTYLTGWFIPLMEIDAVQYANISREMLLNRSFIQVFDNGEDYLDKPPLLFWLSSASMYFFGINQYAYRLPSFLCSLLALYSCYRLCLLFYKIEIALISVLVLASCQAMFLVNHDVRTDTMLMGWVTMSVWQLAAWYQNKQWINLILASVAMAAGMMTKGPIAVMVPVFAFLPHFVLRRQWKQLVKWEYLVIIAIVLVLLLPMMTGLYRQFDLHPEKVMYGQTGTSGLTFFFWTQSFGRITGQSTWHEYDSFLFLYQNMLWSFLPWIIFFSIALLVEITDIIRSGFKLVPNKEWITTGGFIVTYCALASSRAQLPHYIFVVFPLSAIITAKFLYNLLTKVSTGKAAKILVGFHNGLFMLLWLASLVLLYIPFSKINKGWLTVTYVLLALVYVLVIRKAKVVAPLLRNALFTITGINLLLNVFFYPALLQFQPGVAINQFLAKNNITPGKVYRYQFGFSRSLNFYANHNFDQLSNLALLPSNTYIITTQQVKDSLGQQQFATVFRGQDFHVTMLSLRFLNPAKRFKEVTPYYILKKKDD